jgi:hypothetical protein
MSYYDKLIRQQSELSLSNLGFDTTKIEQGSPEWHTSRLGVMTASRAKDIIAVGGLAPFPEDVEIIKDGRQNTVTFDGKSFTGTKAECVSFVRNCLPRLPSDARNDYLLELVAEVATGQPKEQGEFKQTQWGHEHENSARQILAFHIGVQIMEAPFIYADDSMRYGCSPDGIADDHIGVELKCPWTTKVYLDFLLNGEIKPEYLEQCQFSMFVTGLPYWHFGNYDPRMKVNPCHAVTIERDESKMATFRDAVGQMAYDIDCMLSKLGLQFGDQWATYSQLKEAA